MDRSPNAAMVKIRAIDHLVLRAIETERMLDFYHPVLGCEAIRADADQCLTEFGAGDGLIGLVPASARPVSGEGDAGAAARTRLEHFCLTLANWNETGLRQCLHALGVDTRDVGVRPGTREAVPSLYLNDPDGNTVELKGPAAYPRGDPDPGVSGLRVRRLERADAPLYAAQRLRMLQEHPSAYGSSFEEENKLPLERFAERLAPAGTPPEAIYFGAFDAAGALLASAGVRFDQRPKERHRCHLVAMYAVPECRGTGVAALVMRACLAAADTREGIELMQLKVTEGNEAARRLYVAFGFQRYGLEPHAMQIDGRTFGAELMWRPLRDSQGSHDSPRNAPRAVSRPHAQGDPP